MPEVPSAKPPGRAGEEARLTAQCKGKGDVRADGAWDVVIFRCIVRRVIL